MNINNYLKIKSKNNRFYLFDALNNNIYEIDSEENLNCIGSEHLERISDLRVDALSVRSIDEDVNKNAKTLIIEVTENCNIRCTYCIYDDANNSERNHSNNSISKTSAIKIIDDFYKRTNGLDAYLVFYGGEPLLNLKLIEELVEYSNKISEKRIKFSLTTNAILLNLNIFKILIKNKFKITVSIDGPDFIHDANRKTKNGKGTFSIIMENLQSLMDWNEDYFRENVDFNCTITSYSDIPAINEFFLSSELFLEENIRFSSEISENIKINNEISAGIDLNKLQIALKNADRVFASSINNHSDKPNIIQESYFGDIVKKIKYRKLDEKAKTGKKICVPFSNRTYVRSTGDFQFCERIQFYGKINNSNDLEKYSNIFHREFLDFKQESCSQCFAYNFCEMCPASFIENSVFSERLSWEKCGTFRKDVEKAMKLYIEGMEIKDADRFI